MWKNQTTPNLHSSLTPQLKLDVCQATKFCQLSFADAETKQFKVHNSDVQQTQMKSLNINSLQDLLCNFRSKNSSSLNTDNNILQAQDQILDNSSICKFTKQQMIVMQLQKNQELRINLFKAEKTIGDLESLFKNLQQKILNTLNVSKDQVDQKLIQQSVKLKRIDMNETKNKQKRIKKVQNYNNQQKQNCNQKQISLQKQAEIVQIWKSCYSDLIQYVNQYTKDVTFLTDQYKVLEAEHEVYKNKSQKSKKNEKNLLKILKQSNQKLHRSQQTIEKAIQDINDRDKRIQQYQLQNKNIKMKILDCFEQIQKLKRENKMLNRDSLSYKEAGKSLQQQIKDYIIKCQQYQKQLQNKHKLQQIYKQNEESYKKRMISLQQQLNETRTFNENVMDEYKKLSEKINHNEEKLNQKCQVYGKMYEQKLKHSEKTIANLKKQKQSCIQKYQNKFQIIQKQVEKTYKQKVLLEKQVLQKNMCIKQLEEKITRLQQKASNIQIDYKVKLEQKDRQIDHLQQIKNIGYQKNQQLKLELEEVRIDMLLIIEQFKAKELEIQNLRENYENTPKFQQIDQIQVKPISNFKEGKIYKNYSQQNFKNESNKKPQNSGLIWKKMKKQSSSALFECQQNQMFCDEQTNQFLKTNQKGKIDFNYTMPKLAGIQDLEASDQVPELLQLQRIEINSDNLCQIEAPISPKFHDSSYNKNKSKFSLQAFQNKLVLEENAKVLFQLNRTVFK